MTVPSAPRLRRPLARLAVALFAVATTAACSVEVGTAPVDPPVLSPSEGERLERIELSFTQVQLRRGYTQGLAVTGILRGGGRRLIPTDRVEWRSSSPAIAEVTVDGLVIARGEGTALVTAIHLGRSASVDVQVLPR